MPCASGVTIDGIHYGAIEAALDRVQGSNLWLTFAIREGKNREVRNVLGHLGLTVTRLIRVSFGPFQLGELAEGAVEEVPTRVLREQLGDKLIAPVRRRISRRRVRRRRRIAGAAIPRRHRRARRRAARRAPMKAATSRSQNGNDKPKTANLRIMPGARARWIARPRSCAVNFAARAARRARARRATEAAKPRARASAEPDRKGRRVAVERYGQPPVQTQAPPRARTRPKGAAQARTAAAARPIAPSARARANRKAAADARRRRPAARAHARRAEIASDPADRRPAARIAVQYPACTPMAIRSRGARVLDLFAGTGALGIEAASHGAAFTLFIDDGAEARALLARERRRARPRRRHAHLPPRRHQARPRASARAVLARLPRPALWTRPGREGARSAARRRMVCAGRAHCRRRSQSKPRSPRRRDSPRLERRRYDDTEFVFLKFNPR